VHCSLSASINGSCFRPCLKLPEYVASVHAVKKKCVLSSFSSTAGLAAARMSGGLQRGLCVGCGHADLDECRLPRVRRTCSLPHQQCRNAVGSYMCANMCPVGYRYDADRHYCQGISAAVIRVGGGGPDVWDTPEHGSVTLVDFHCWNKVTPFLFSLLFPSRDPIQSKLHSPSP